ncbi:MAG: hypothetical protein RJA16_733, partial [Planctomycetota bacterium]
MTRWRDNVCDADSSSPGGAISVSRPMIQRDSTAEGGTSPPAVGSHQSTQGGAP